MKGLAHGFEFVQIDLFRTRFGVIQRHLETLAVAGTGQIEHGVHLRYHGAGERTAVMAVDALEFHGLFIDEHHAVADTDGPDPHALADHFFRRRDL